MQIEYRPCRVTIIEKTPHGSKRDVCDGLFHGWISEQWTYSPVMQGQVGGQMQSTYGIVELRTGEVRMFSPNQIKFLDNKHAEYAFPETDHTIRQAVNILQNELLKKGDLYNGFHASIESVLEEFQNEQELMDDGYNSCYLAECILKRLIGE